MHWGVDGCIYFRLVCCTSWIFAWISCDIVSALGNWYLYEPITWWIIIIGIGHVLFVRSRYLLSFRRATRTDYWWSNSSRPSTHLNALEFFRCSAAYPPHSALHTAHLPPVVAICYLLVCQRRQNWEHIGANVRTSVCILMRWWGAWALARTHNLKVVRVCDWNRVRTDVASV